MTMEELWDDQFPKANRFIVTFRSKHLLKEGGWCHQDQRRFRLADSAKDALDDVLKELRDQRYWPTGLHEWTNAHCQSASEYSLYAYGGFRFKDIRKQHQTTPN